MQMVPTIELAHMSEAQKRAYIIADNKLAENAGWDQELLAAELEYISVLDIDFDLTLTGFETPEIDILLAERNFETAAEDIISEFSGPVISKAGDLWLLGPHRLLCANALDPKSYETLLDQEKAQLVFTDPPYNVPISGHVSGKGNTSHSEFVMASGEMSPAQFTAFLKAAFSNLITHSAKGSLHYICMDWRHMRELLEAGDQYDEIKNLCIWNKTNGGMGSHYRSKHELVFVFKNGKAPHINNIDLGRHGRYRTNVWDYAGVNTFHTKRMDEAVITEVEKQRKVAQPQEIIIRWVSPGDKIEDN